VIPVDPSKTSQLESLAQLLDSGQFGEPTVVREPGEGTAVTDASEASAAAGFKVRVPEMLPAGAAKTEFLVAEGPAIHYEMDRAMMQAFVDAAGLKKVRLPDVEKVSIDVDVPMMVSQQYASGSGRLTVVQLPSPEVNIPDGLDPVALGQVAFEFLGMPAADAVRLARTIDWTSTVVIPLPTDVAKYREVTVDGVSGLLLESEKTRRPTQAVLWQRDGIVHAVTAEGLDVKWALAAADSLR
jgi:hypothetical protein